VLRALHPELGPVGVVLLDPVGLLQSRAGRGNGLGHELHRIIADVDLAQRVLGLSRRKTFLDDLVGPGMASQPLAVPVVGPGVVLGGRERACRDTVVECDLPDRRLWRAADVVALHGEVVVLRGCHARSIERGRTRCEVRPRATVTALHAHRGERAQYQSGSSSSSMGLSASPSGVRSYQPISPARSLGNGIVP